MWNDFGEYIVKLCENQSSEKELFHNELNHAKIVEIGIGKFLDVSKYLEDINYINLLKIDINPSYEDITYDDISNPNLALYANTKIIYSIRPPYELQPYLENIANIVGAILIIVPLFNEDLNTSKNMKLINYKKATFFRTF